VNSLVWSSRCGTRDIRTNSASAIFLVEEVADVRRVFARDAESSRILFMMIFGERFGGLTLSP